MIISCLYLVNDSICFDNELSLICFIKKVQKLFYTVFFSIHFILNFSPNFIPQNNCTGRYERIETKLVLNFIYCPNCNVLERQWFLHACISSKLVPPLTQLRSGI